MSKKLLLKDAHIEGIRYFDVYRKQGGYEAAEKALKMTPEAIVEAVSYTHLDVYKRQSQLSFSF